MHANATNITGVTGLLQYNNTVTDGYFGMFFLAALWIVSFLALSTYRKDAAIVPATFVTWLVCALFVAIGLADTGLLMWFTAGLVMSFLLNKYISG